MYRVYARPAIPKMDCAWHFFLQGTSPKQTSRFVTRTAFGTRICDRNRISRLRQGRFADLRESHLHAALRGGPFSQRAGFAYFTAIRRCLQPSPSARRLVGEGKSSATPRRKRCPGRVARGRDSAVARKSSHLGWLFAKSFRRTDQGPLLHGEVGRGKTC